MRCFEAAKVFMCWKKLLWVHVTFNLLYERRGGGEGKGMGQGEGRGKRERGERGGVEGRDKEGIRGGAGGRQ